MRLTVNGDPHEAAEGATVAALVAQVAPDPRGVAVALDGEVVPRSRWASTSLALGQSVEILKAVQGG